MPHTDENTFKEMKEIKYLERLEIIVNEADFSLAEALIGQALAYGWEEESLTTGETKLIMHCEKDDHDVDPLLDTLSAQVLSYLPEAKITRKTIEKSDWTNAWKEYFTPISVGDFLIVPPWHAEENIQSEQEEFANIDSKEDLKNTQNTQKKHKIIIEPKSAFGTGHHASTVLCLKAISALHAEGKIKKNMEFLDLGTGTGILGIGCVKYGLTGYGLDIESLAVANAMENKELSNVKHEDFLVELGSIDKAQGKQYDVVIANILAAPLREMAEDIMACVKPHSCLILSGFLGTQVDALEKAYAKMGKARRFTQETDMKDGEWIALYWGDTVF